MASSRAAISKQFIASVSETRNAIANSAGFRITSVAINGRKQLTQDEMLAIGGVNGHSSLLFLDASSVREKLKADPWISEATVLKLYPGQLRIDIVERAPFALWQRNGQLSVISEDGAVLERLCFAAFPQIAAGGGQGRRDPRQGFSGAARPLSADQHRDQGRDPGRRTALEPAPQ